MSGSGGSRWRWLLVGLGAALGGLWLLDALDVPSRTIGWTPRRWDEPAARPVAPPEGYPPRIPEERELSPPSGVAARLLEDDSRLEVADGVTLSAVDLDGRRRNAVTGRPPYAFRARVTVPDGGELWLGVNQARTGLHVAALRFRVRAIDGSGSRVVYDERVPSHREAWTNARIDLDRWASREIDLLFECEPDPADAQPAAEARAYWADLFLHAPRSAARRPNVVLLLLDTLRPDHLGCYGYPRPTSPFIDELAAGGVMFRNAFSVAPWTDPSIVGLLTGLYPSDVWEPAPHAETIRKGLPGRVATLAEVLASAGYYTLAASDHPGVNFNRFGRGFDAYAMLHHVDGPYDDWRKTRPEKVLAQVEQSLDARPAGAGLFFYLHLIYPRVPYVPPEPYASLFGSGEYVVDPGNREGLINLYDAEIRLTDDVLRSVLRMMSERGMDEDWIVVLLSDHGEGFWEHGLFEHGNSLYNELLRIPLILNAPGHLPRGAVFDETVRIIDVGPTILDLVGLEPPAAWRGRSVLSIVRGSPDEARLAYSEFPHTWFYRGHAVQSATHKLIESGDETGRHRRFDLREDPLELAPLEGERFDWERSLLAWMEALRGETAEHRALVDPRLEEPSPEMLDRLRALGYVD